MSNGIIYFVMKSETAAESQLYFIKKIKALDNSKILKMGLCKHMKSQFIYLF